MPVVPPVNPGFGAISFRAGDLARKAIDRAMSIDIEVLSSVFTRFDAARLAGMSRLTIAFREVLPGAVHPVIALVGVTVGAAILVESSLAFLGLSDPNLVSWGGMVANGRAVLRIAPYLVALPGIAVALTILAVSLSGDGLAARMAPRRGR